MLARLAFCIPTYNFGPYIGDTLRSIIAQADERVQIVVVDGGSTDNTVDIVAEARRAFPNITFLQREMRYGIDRDILETVAQANADYCWLFSSDDILSPGAVSRAFAAIDTGGWDVFVMGMTLCDVNMHPLAAHRILSCPEPRTFDWSKPHERAEYFRLAHTSTAFFSFISDVIIRRDAWLRAPTVDRFVGSCWIIAAKVFAMSQRDLKVRFDPAIFVLKRGDNDSFATDGLIRRVALSLRGFRDLGTYFFGGTSFEAAQIDRVIRNEYPFLAVLDLKRRIVPYTNESTRRDFYRLVSQHYAGATPWNHWPYAIIRLIPTWVLTIARPPYIFLRQIARSFRHY